MNPFLQADEEERLAQERATAAQTPLTPSPSSPVTAPANPEITLTLGDRAIDILRGVVGGTRDAVQETIDTGLAGMEKVSSVVDQVTGGNPEVTKQAYKDIKSKLTFSEVEKNETVLGEAVRGVTKFGIGFAGAGKVLRPVKGFKALESAGVAGRLTAGGLQGAVGDFIVTDPHAARLADLIESVPSLRNPITEYLASDKDDSALEGKLKGALEGVVPGVLAGALFEGVAATRTYFKARRAGIPQEEAEKILDKVADKVEEPLKEAARDGIDVSIHPASLFDETLSDAGKSAAKKEIDQSIRIFEDTTFNGQRFGNVMEANDNMVVVQKNGKDAGYIRYERDPKGGFWVRKVEVLPEFRRQGLATQLYDKVESIEGPYRGPETTLTSEGAAFQAARKARKEAVTTPAEVTTRLTADDREIFRESVRRTITSGVTAEPWQGPLNYTKLNSEDSVKQMIDNLVITTRDELKHIGGVYKPDRAKTLAMTESLAEVMGEDASSLFTKLSALAKSTEDLDSTLVAGKMLIKRVSDDLFNVATKLDNGLGNDQDKVLFKHMTDILATSLDHVAGIQTAAARTTGAGRIAVTEGITKKNFADLLEKVGGDEYVRTLAGRIRMAQGDPKAIVSAVKGTPTALQKGFQIHNFLWINGLLSGVKTTAVNIGSNFIQTVLMPGFRLAGGVLGHDKDQVAEALYHYKFMRSSLADAWQYARKSWETSRSILDPGNAGFATNLDNPFGAGYETLAKIISTPGRLLGAQDEFFKQITYRSHIMASAQQEAFKRGLDDTLTRELIQTRLDQAVGHMGQALDKEALLAAQMTTFTQPLKARSWFEVGGREITLGEGLAHLSQNPLLKGTVLPFIKVPTNLMRQVWDMSPAALARRQFWEEISAGGERKAVAMGKLGVGTMIGAFGTMLAFEGRITGAAPKDPTLRAQLGSDWQPYSFVFPQPDGTNHYVSYARLDPFSTFFGIAADMKHMAGKIKDREYEDVAVALATSLAKSVSSKTYLQGVAGALDALGGDESAMQKFLNSYAGSHVPGITQLVNTDDELKDVRGMVDAVMARLPGFSQFVETKRDNFGEPVQPPAGWPWSAINPFVYHTGSNDPVRKELSDLALLDSEARFPLPNPILFGTKANGLDLREVRHPKTGQSAYDRWMQLHSELTVGGKTLHDRLGDLINSDTYIKGRQALGNGSALYKESLPTTLIGKEMDTFKRLTYEKLKREFPGVAQAEIEFKRSSAVTRVQGPEAGTPLDTLREIAGQR